MSEPIILPAARRWPLLLTGVVCGAALVAGGVVIAGLDRGDDASAAVEEVTLVTAPVEQRDLIEEVEWVADLTYGDSVTVSAPSDGTVTSAPEPGAVLRRGDVVVEIDEKPVTLFYGTVPAWRDLADGDEGDDVLQLETNLVALGFDPDGDVVVDQEFDRDTEDMVEAWQASLELDETGEFTTDLVAIVQGPVAVVDAPTVGTPARAGDALATVSARAEVTTVVPTSTGVVADLVEAGTPVSHGTLLMTIGGTEVRAAFGLAPVEGIDPDDGVAREYVLVAPDQQVAGALVAAGDEIDAARPTLELSHQTLSVVVPVGLADQDEWSEGQSVEIELPDETTVAGMVSDVATVAGDVGPGETPTVDVTVEVVDLVADDLPASEVIVIVAGDAVFDAVVVPTRALVALAEGGFAVEQAQTDGTTTLIAVDTGAFDDGMVEIIGSSLVPGDLVMVPS